MTAAGDIPETYGLMLTLIKSSAATLFLKVRFTKVSLGSSGVSREMMDLIPIEAEPISSFDKKSWSRQLKVSSSLID
jgi:hypothetical protein